MEILEYVKNTSFVHCPIHFSPVFVAFMAEGVLPIILISSIST